MAPHNERTAVNDTLTIVDINASDPLIDEAFAVLHELRTKLSREQYVAMFAAGADAQWTSTVAVLDGTVVGIVNWRVQQNTAHGYHVFIDDLCTTATRRSGGVGKALNDYVVQRARALECECVTLTSGNQRTDAHRFYLREGYVDASKVFRLEL